MNVTCDRALSEGEGGEEEKSKRTWNRVSKLTSAPILKIRTDVCGFCKLYCCINIYVIHQQGGPYWEKLCPRSWMRHQAVFKTEGTVFPNTDRPRLVNNIFIFFLEATEMLAKRTRTIYGCNYSKILHKLNNFLAST